MTSDGLRTAAQSGLPRLTLCDLPTPVERAEKLEAEARSGPLFIKHDDSSATPYGGNKPRKLEWLLGHAKARGVTRVLSFGGLGTNHGLALAYYGRREGLACDLVLVDQPVTGSVRRRLRQMQAAGARLFYGRNTFGTVLRSTALLARHPRTAIIMPGGSNVLGVLGFVEAGLELAAQVHAGELLAPKRIYIACGSGGSASGLALGLALAGLESRVIAVLVTNLLPPSLRTLKRQARSARRRLVRNLPQQTELRLRLDNRELELEVDTRFLGPGYGAATQESEQAIERAQTLAGMHLEPVYTGKALAALLARERGSKDPILFWNTYSAHEPELTLPAWQELPPAFHRFFAESK